MQAAGFALQYSKNEIANEVLWENHCHTHFELIAVLTGRVLIATGGFEIPLGAGDAVLLPPLCYHTVTATKKCTYRRLTAAFDKSAIPTVLQDLPQWKEACVFSAEKGVCERLRMLCRAENTVFYAPLAESLMIQMLYTCAATAPKEKIAVADTALHGALLYIEEHLCEKLTLADVAAHAACSVSFLCHRFREKMRISPKQYILQKRMALAAKLLNEGVPPTQVALRVGYENYSNFYRIYQKYLQGNAAEE